VFVASSLIHMVLPWHKSDYPKMSNEDQVLDALRPLAIPPGDYFIPRPTGREEMRSPEFADKIKKGPVIVMTVLPNASLSMARNLVLWFVYLVAVGILTAYVLTYAVDRFAGQRGVFRLVGVTAFLGYAAALWQMTIWYQRSWSITVKATIDGLIYAAITAATFAWLFPRIQ